jgi:8-amino-7-oxononanoate synthase
MGIRDTIIERSKKALMSPALMRVVSDDRVMKAAQGVMDARSRVRAAWHVLLNGHDLPNIDPALDENLGKDVVAGPSTVAPAKKNGTNGSSASNGASASNGSNGAHEVQGSSDMAESMRERTSLAGIGGKDIFEKCQKFMAADNARKMGIYPFFRPLDLNDGPEAVINDRRVIMFASRTFGCVVRPPRPPSTASARA